MSRNLVNNDQSGISANPETSFTSADSASMHNGEFPFDDASLVGETGKNNDSLGRSNNNNNNNSLHRANDALAFWERQRRLFDRMHLTFANSDLPLAPSTVKLEIAGSESLLVNISEPRHTGGALVTTYKVEWSVSPRFDALEGEQSAFGVVDNVDVKIANLIPGQAYYVRVSAMNLKGYGKEKYCKEKYCFTHCNKDD